MSVLWAPGHRLPLSPSFRNSNVKEVCFGYTCHTCDSSENARRFIIIDSGCSAHMFSDWRVSRNFRTKTGVQVRCANGQLVEASGVGDEGFLTNVLLVPQLKTNLISEGKLALTGWKTMTYNRVEEIYVQKWNWRQSCKTSRILYTLLIRSISLLWRAQT